MNIRLEHLTKTYPPRRKGEPASTVVSDVTLSVNSGELVTLLGPSGCGKTTILRMVAGLEEPSSGSIAVGSDVFFAPGTYLPPHKRGIGMVFQNYALWPHRTVAQNISFSLEVRHASKEEIHAEVTRVLNLVGMGTLRDRYPHELSGGQQQRVALARAIAQKPKVLLLDEPLSNLDAKLREQMRSELRSLQRELGLTMLYVTHDRLEALELSHRMAILDHGRLIQMGTPAEVTRSPANEFVAHFVR